MSGPTLCWSTKQTCIKFIRNVIEWEKHHHYTAPLLLSTILDLSVWNSPVCVCMCIYYMEESVLLGTKPLVDSIRHFIRDPSGVFSVCHLCECRIVQ